MKDIIGMARMLGVESCACGRCVDAVISKRPFPANLEYPFIVCADCGNKRCPKATHHDNSCTNSNEPNQEGSSYQYKVYDPPRTVEELRAKIDSWLEEEEYD